MTKGKEKGSYDLAMIKQIVASGRDIVDRVMVQLIPQAADRMAEGHPGLEEARRITLKLLNHLFTDGQISCPKCGAKDAYEAQGMCFNDESCPLSEPVDGPQDEKTLKSPSGDN